jgi:hypothetical protein
LIGHGLFLSKSEPVKISPRGGPKAAAEAAQYLVSPYGLSTIGTLLATTCCVASRVGRIRAVEIKIVILLALIAVIATASYLGGRPPSQERTN